MKIDPISPNVTLITCTGDRQRVFRLCERWMVAQLTGWAVQWIVVDDGGEPTPCTMGQQHIRRERSPHDPAHTMPINLLRALEHVRGSAVLFIEDDDWYSPTYIERMVRVLRVFQLVGEAHTRSYHVPSRQFTRHVHDWHAVLAGTGIRAERLPFLRGIIEQDLAEATVDLRLWRQWRGQCHLFVTPESDPLWCSLKGLHGEHVHPDHDAEWIGWRPDDRKLTKLRRWVGEEAAELYADLWPAGPEREARLWQSWTRGMRMAAMAGSA